MADPETIDLADFDEPLPAVRFTTGQTRSVHAFNAIEHDLHGRVAAAVQAGDTSAANALGLQLLRRIVPDASDADLSSLSARQVEGLVLLARRQITRAELAVAQAATAAGNGVGAAGAAPRSTAPSSPSTGRGTSSRGSRARLAATGGPSSSSPTTARSSRTRASSTTTVSED